MSLPKELLVTRFSYPQRDVALVFSACMNCIVTWFVYAAFFDGGHPHSLFAHNTHAHNTAEMSAAIFCGCDNFCL